MNKKRTAKAVLVAFGLSVALPTAALAATDINGHWAENVLTKWEKNGLVSGYADDTMRPDHAITRAEFIALINRVAGFNDSSATISFTDVSEDDWYAKQVAIAVSAGYIGGFEDGTFRPDAYVTRAQAASMIARFANLAADTDRAAQFNDAANIPDWAKGVIGAVANAGYMIGDEKGNFNADKALTRAEAIAALDRIFKVADLQTLEASLDATNGSVMKGSTKIVTVSSLVDGFAVRAVSTNEGTATVSVAGNKITITGVEKGNATIAITVSAPGYADAKLTYSINVTTAGGFSGGGSTSNSTVTVPHKTNPEVDGVSIKTVIEKNAAIGAKDATTYVELGSSGYQVKSITLAAGSSFDVTFNNNKYTLTLASSIERNVTNNADDKITVGDVKNAIDTAGTTQAAIDALNDASSTDPDRVLIDCKEISKNAEYAWYIDGMEYNEMQVVFKLLDITLTK